MVRRACFPHSDLAWKMLYFGSYAAVGAFLLAGRIARLSEQQRRIYCFLDAHDRLTPNAVESHLSCFAKHPEAGFVVRDIDHIAPDGSYAGSPRWPLLESNNYKELLRVNHVANTIAVMFRRSTAEQVGGFRQDCSGGGSAPSAENVAAHKVAPEIPLAQMCL